MTNGRLGWSGACLVALALTPLVMAGCAATPPEEDPV